MELLVSPKSSLPAAEELDTRRRDSGSSGIVNPVAGFELDLDSSSVISDITKMPRVPGDGAQADEDVDSAHHHVVCSRLDVVKTCDRLAGNGPGLATVEPKETTKLDHQVLLQKSNGDLRPCNSLMVYQDNKQRPNGVTTPVLTMEDANGKCIGNISSPPPGGGGGDESNGGGADGSETDRGGADDGNQNNNNNNGNLPPHCSSTYSAFKRGNVIKGILCPSMTNSFRAPSLERSYLTYSHRQRQKSLILVNVVDLVLKIVLASVWIGFNHPTTIQAHEITWSVCCVISNFLICVLGSWRLFANNYLHWAAVCTWLLLNLQGFVGEGLGFAEREYLIWYVLFIIFVPYAMLPLPLKWCMIAGSVSAVCHLIVTTINKFLHETDTTCIIRQMIANSLLYLAINFAGMYTKYLTDRGQRLAFIETHKAMEHKRESEKEYQRTQRLLDSKRNLFQIPNKTKDKCHSDGESSTQNKHLYAELTHIHL
ncbi:adenylyl cyclase 78C-like [Uranotaenia lowii]|uniref:adenylyl cyclase 78C-like n=1 Tax=Uranotaenia lowii TaxID=190385 RepID=UPI00247ABAB1|nr:adenylyl cyclase 78C-like [Uranotaenia lowii]